MAAANTYNYTANGELKNHNGIGHSHDGSPVSPSSGNGDRGYDIHHLGDRGYNNGPTDYSNGQSGGYNNGNSGSISRFVTPGGNPIDSSQPAFPVYHRK